MIIERMFYWSPISTSIQTWIPEEGWNRTWAEKDKIQCTRLYFFFHNVKHYSSDVASIMAHMMVYKEKCHGLRYSEEQERELAKALHCTIAIY
jgi:hypothetical protein